MIKIKVGEGDGLEILGRNSTYLELPTICSDLSEVGKALQSHYDIAGFCCVCFNIDLFKITKDSETIALSYDGSKLSRCVSNP